MALVNPQIAMSYRPTVEYQPRNALAEAAQIQNILSARTQQESAQTQQESARTQQEMARMQLDKMRRDEQALDTLMQTITAKGGPTDPIEASTALIQTRIPHYMDLGFKMQQTLEQTQRDRELMGLPPLRYGAAAPAPAPAPSAAPAGELVAPPITGSSGTMREIAPGGAVGPEVPLAAAPAATNVLAPAPAPAPAAANALAMSPEEQRARAMLLSSNPGVREAGKVELARLTAAHVVGPGGSLVIGGKPVFTAPERQDTDLIREYNVAKREGFQGSLFDYKRQIALAGRPITTTPPAPTITQIQDPTNPSQMITIDARQYRGGGVGSPGVIGTSGKTAPVAAAEQKRTEGAQQAQDILDTLRTAYDTLDRARAVPSQQRNALSNALSYVAGTGMGQVAGRVVGTEAQTQRDIIQSARNQMLNAIKNATGMSAQQLNSNVEFRSWLEALTDPTRSIEANRAILDNMEKFIASGGKYSVKKEGGAAPAAAPAGGATGGWSVVR